MAPGTISVTPTPARNASDCMGVLSLGSEAMLGQILEGSPIPTFVLDHQHRITHWNRALEAISGFSATDMIGTAKQWLTFYAEQRPVLADLIIDGATAERINQQYAVAGPSAVIEGAYEAEAYFPNMAGQARWLYFTAAPLRDGLGQIVGAIETLQDVTARKQAELALHKQQDQLEELVSSRTDELSQANEELSQYAYVVAHDLRSPLRAIRNYADFLHEDLGALAGQEQQSYFSGLKKALQHGEQLVGDLLVYAGIGRSETDSRTIDLETLLLELIDLMHLPGDAEVILDPALPSVRGDHTLLKQVFQNLLSNAVKFNQASLKRISIGWRMLDDMQCEVAVRDNGIGIDTKYLDHIFRMFQRLHTQQEYAGTGIGLAIVRKAVSRLNGQIRIESSLGVGTTFFVCLPLATTRDTA